MRQVPCSVYTLALIPQEHRKCYGQKVSLLLLCLVANLRLVMKIWSQVWNFSPKINWGHLINKYVDLDETVNALRGENLNYNSCTNLLLRKSQNLLFLAPEVQWALKVYRVCSIHVSFKFFEPCPYLVCHMTTIENV